MQLQRQLHGRRQPGRPRLAPWRFGRLTGRFRATSGRPPRRACTASATPSGSGPASSGPLAKLAPAATARAAPHGRQRVAPRLPSLRSRRCATQAPDAQRCGGALGGRRSPGAAGSASWVLWHAPCRRSRGGAGASRCGRAAGAVAARAAAGGRFGGLGQAAAARPDGLGSAAPRRVRRHWCECEAPARSHRARRHFGR